AGGGEKKKIKKGKEHQRDSNNTPSNENNVDSKIYTNSNDEKEDTKNKTHTNNENEMNNYTSDKFENVDFSLKINDDMPHNNDQREDITFESKLSSDGDENKDDYLKSTLARIGSFLKDDDNKILNYYNFEYLIKPFDLVLPVEQSSNKKELKAKLEISEKWEGITLTRTQITKIIEIMNEANKSRSQTNKLLLKYACTVKLDIESLRNETKNEFMNLYNKVLGEKYNISKVELTNQELNRLQILYDVVGVRHLAKWRLQCQNTLEKIIEEKNLKKKYLYDSIYKQQSWWSWVTGSKKDIENKVQSILKSEQDIINEKELHILQEAVTNEDNYDVVVPTKYDFEFKLANFSINVYDDCKKKRKYVDKEEEELIQSEERMQSNGEEHIKGISHLKCAGNDEQIDVGTIRNKHYSNNSFNDNLNDEISLSGSVDSLLNSTPDMSATNS
ncbi:conserved Plasmodium protein, unknown function, partial [Plasmodium malariae]